MFAYHIVNKDKRSCQIDPLVSKKAGKEVYLLPANCTFSEPLPDKEGFNVLYDQAGDDWYYEPISEPSPEEKKQEEIRELKQKLNNSDYAVIKIAEGAATKEEYADLIAQRQEWRARINELEGNE